MAVKSNGTPIGDIKDSDWIATSFMLSGEGITRNNASLERWRRFSSADLKYFGTGLGEHSVLNPTPQFTPLADIPRRGLFRYEGMSQDNEFTLRPGTSDGKTQPSFSYGMGRCYSESIDDNKQVVHLRFGTVTYKGLVTFFTSFYDTESANLARYGRSSIAYYFGLAAGTIATLPLFPIILAGRMWNFMVGRSSSRYMDLKPNMPLFWNRVNVIYNNLGANLGIIARTWENEGKAEEIKETFEDLEKESGFNSYKSYMHRVKELNGVFKDSGAIDFLKVARNAARREIQANQILENAAMNARSIRETRDAILAFIDNPTSAPAMKDDVTIEGYLKSFINSVLGSLKDIQLEVSAIEDKVTNAVNDVITGANPNALEDMRTERDNASNTQNQEPSVSNETSTDQAAVDSFIGNTSGFLDNVPSPAGTPIGTGAQATVPLNGAGTTASKQAAAPTNTTTTEVDPNGNPISPPVEAEVAALDNSSLNTRRTQEFKSVAKSIETGAGVAWETVQGWFKDAGNFFDTEWQQGSTFLNLSVQYTGASTISFSNSLKDTELQAKFNGVSGTARDARVSLADYQTGFGFVDLAIQMTRDVFAGAMDGVQLSGLLALAGNAFVDIPKQWDSSQVTFPTASFRIEVRHPYGNELSAYLNAYPVVAALLAGTLPISTGPQSYTSPNVCECYCQGLAAIRLGMITDLSITAGAGNLGYTSNRRPLAFDIDFTVADLSSVMHMPVANGFNPLTPTRRVLDDDNAFMDYLSTITGMHMRDMIDPRRKLAIRLAARQQDYRAFVSPSNIAAQISNISGIMKLNRILGSGMASGT